MATIDTQLQALAAAIAGLPEQVRPALNQIAGLVQTMNQQFLQHCTDNQGQFDQSNNQVQAVAGRASVPDLAGAGAQ